MAALLRPDLYRQWLDPGRLCPELREVDADRPNERLVQWVWRQQRLRDDALRTAEGRRLRVLHPGFWNREPGPDFREAVLQFDDEPPVTGDVEVDLEPADWNRHGHGANPAFRQVRLHAVWRLNGPPAAPAATVALQPALDAPFEEIVHWLESEHGEAAPAEEGACARAWSRLPAALVTDLVEQAALVRLERKAHRIRARAREAGWEAALWEAVFTALGYKHNVWPMRHLARVLPRLGADRPDVAGWQTRLLGAAGFLPRDLTRRDPTVDRYVRRAWDRWWREQAAFQSICLPASAWRLAGVRPANRPERRLALAAHWLARGDVPGALEQWLAEDISPQRLIPSLAAVLRPGEDDFWVRHWTLQASCATPMRLLGDQRLGDLAVNVILPWLWCRAEVGGQSALRGRVEERYLRWPALQDNAVLRLARARLLPAWEPPRPLRAAHQQGLLQMVRDFCGHSDACCRGCPLPARLARLVGEIEAAEPGNAGNPGGSTRHS
ncbi:MAG: DUF2851 family protein [Verrucomicrobia bacterium]|nr:MAG: DUF2851 family protein [Verrucomicrobiota bacterium]